MGRPAGHPSRPEASGIRVPPRNLADDGRAWPIVCLLARVRGVRPAWHDSV
jgi:hypothetical protein